LKLTIIGNGSMAQALANGLYKSYELEFMIRDLSQAAFLQERYNTTTIPIKNGDIEGKNILLCIKPYALNEVGTALHGKARSLYSILAGTPLESLRNAISSNYTIRAMPNVAASIAQSATTLTGDEALKQEAIALFDSIGKTLWVDSEKKLDIATAIAGSGPAFLALIAEAMMDGGVLEGLSRDESMQLVESLFGGFSSLLATKHPALIKDSVMSPAGTTAAGYRALEKRGVRDAMIKAIHEAFRVTQR